MLRILLAGLLVIGTASCSDSGSETVSKYNDPITVVNNGKSGDNTKMLLSRVNDMERIKFDVSILLVGTNDTINWGGGQIKQDNYLANLKALANKLSSNSKELIIMTIPPAIEEDVLKKFPDGHFDSYGSVNSKINTYNNIVIDVANEFNAQLFNLNNMIYKESGINKTSATYFLDDGVHLNEQAYKALAKQLYKKIAPLKPNSVGCFGDSLTFGYSVNKSYPEYLSEKLNNH